MPGKAISGRGAIARTPHRFAQRRLVPGAEEAARLAGEAPDTEWRPLAAQGIISRNHSPDVPFDRSINPFQGCEHGCVYCYARPSHAYLDLSPGLDFETRIFYKPNAVELLLEAWQKPGYECAPITIGANTDPYQPLERRLGLTRRLLEAFLEHRHPVSLITKGTLLARDLDLLRALASENLCSVAVSIPTMNDALKRILEPRVPSAARRFDLLERLRDAGVPTSLLLAPVIPAVNDGEIERILSAAAGCDVTHAAWILLRLPHELREVFGDWLATHLPERRRRVLSLLCQAHGGRAYDSRFGHRQRGAGPYAGMLARRFRAACRRHGIATGRRPGERLDCSRFRAPGARQLALSLG